MERMAPNSSKSTSQTREAEDTEKIETDRDVFVKAVFLIG